MGYNLILISIYILLIAFNVETYSSTSKFVTKTVYGFLDFTTTIGNTVMIFSPESAPTLDFTGNKIESVKVIETKPIKSYGKDIDVNISPTKSLLNNSSKSANARLQVTKKNNFYSLGEISVPKPVSPNQLRKTNKTIAYTESNLYTPEYDLLSRQPTEYIEESYKLVNINASSRNHNKFRSPNSRICDKANGNEACMTSKYSQISEGASKVVRNVKAKISASASPRILKTAAPSILTASREEHTVSSSFNLHRQSGLSQRFRTKSFSQTMEVSMASKQPVEATIRTTAVKEKKTSNRSKSKRRNKHSRNIEREKRIIQTSSTEGGGRRTTHRLKMHTTNIDLDGSSSIYMFKLNRTPGRWQYRTSPKPKINIRKAASGHNMPLFSNSSVAPTDLVGSVNNVPQLILGNVSMDLVSSGSQNGAVVNNADSEENQKFLVQTLNVEISTPLDFQDKYYEIVTIKTPYTFQAGVVKKTRYITVTSTLQKSLEPESTVSEIFEGPLTENILKVSSNEDDIKLDGSITTLPPIYLMKSEETPCLEITTESYTFTQKQLGTKVLPLVREGENVTSYITAIHTYDVKNLITVTKTLLPHDTDKFIPSKSLKDFSINLDAAGSEINFDLEFTDEDAKEENAKEQPFNSSSPANSPTSSSPNQDLQQLALFNIFKSISQHPTPVTTPTLRPLRPIVKIHTLWQSHVIPIVNGLSTNYKTISKSVGTIDKTEYEVNTIVLPSSAEPQVNSFLLPDPRQFQTITSPLLQQTIVTETNSKVLKLTFGAKTAYTTLYSTNVLPKVITAFITTSYPVQPTVAFPGYFPPPYPPYPYIG